MGKMVQTYLASLFSLTGNVALVTYGKVSVRTIDDNPYHLLPGSGCTRGIGQTLALALAKAGADIVLVQVRIILHMHKLRQYLHLIHLER